MRNIFVLSLAATFLFSGCSSKVEIEGEAFVENNGVATKLANVEIQIVSEENFAKYIKSKAAGIDAEVAKINSQIESREKSIADLNKSAQAVMEAQMKMASLGGWNVNSLGGQYMQQQQNALSAQVSASISKSSDAVESSRRDIEKLKKSIDGLKSGKNGAYYYSDKVPEPILKVSTNSDGKFKIEASSEKRVALVASKGDNFWFIWVTPKGAKNLNLTNANSLDTNCDVCIFNGKTTPQSL